MRDLSIRLHFFCQFVVTGTLFTTHIPPSLSPPALVSIYCAFHTNCQFAVLWKGRVVFFSFCYSLVLLQKVCYEKSWLLDGTQAAFLSPDLSSTLLSFLLLFRPLTHIPPHLSFNFIWGWGLVKILSIFLAFTMPLSAFSAIVSH